MRSVFLKAWFAQAALLDVVLPEQRGEPATCGGAAGLRLMLEEASFARLDHYLRSLGVGWQTVTLDAVGAPKEAQECLSPLAAPEAAPVPETMREALSAEDSALALATATEIMAAFGQIDAARLHRRLGPIRVRASSRLRAEAEAAPHDLRRAPGQIAIKETRRPYAHFFAVEEVDLSFPRFDGAPSPVVTRALFVSGDAVTVLPYDPVRDRVLLVEQFRAGPFGRGDGNPWQLEAIAGRIDPGETPEACARREAMEEAGLALEGLHQVGAYYPSPGAKTEFLYSYVALTDLPDGSAGVFGMAEEAEDIRGHLIDFDAAMALVASGEVQNAPLILTLLWLQRERPRFRV